MTGTQFFKLKQNGPPVDIRKPAGRSSVFIRPRLLHAARGSTVFCSGDNTRQGPEDRMP